MDTLVRMDDIPSSNSTSRAGVSSYPITAVPDYDSIRIYDVINGKEAVASGILHKLQSGLSCPEVELYREQIIVNNDDFMRFKHHVESTEVRENLSVKNLIKKYSK